MEDHVRKQPRRLNMKWLIVLVSLVSLASLTLTGCASAKKQDGSGANATPQATTKSPATKAAEPTTTDAFQKITCTSGEDSRQLEVVKKGAGCALDYTKSGKASAVSTSAKGTEHCVSVQTRIRSKLEKAGFTCS